MKRRLRQLCVLLAAMLTVSGCARNIETRNYADHLQGERLRSAPRVMASERGIQMRVRDDRRKAEGVNVGRAVGGVADCLLALPFCVLMAPMAAVAYAAGSEGGDPHARIAATLAKHASNERLRAAVSRSLGVSDDAAVEFPRLVVGVDYIQQHTVENGYVDIHIGVQVVASPSPAETWEHSMHYATLPRRASIWYTNDRVVDELDRAMEALSREIEMTYLRAGPR